VKSAILAAFGVDALSLGWHWVYDVSLIKRPIDSLIDPQAQWHKVEKAGDSTSFGDQMLVLLESVKTKGKFDAEEFSKSWQGIWTKEYKGYVDHATKDTLKNLSEGVNFLKAGSKSEDFTPIARLAPLLLAYANDEKGLVAAAKLLTQLTHNFPESLVESEIFAHVLYDVVHGSAPIASLKNHLKARKQGDQDDATKKVVALIEKGLDAVDKETIAAVKEFGQACGYESCLPSTVQALAKYEESFQKAIEETIAAGGENAIRSTVIATILGAYHSYVPGYTKNIKAYKKVQELLA